MTKYLALALMFMPSIASAQVPPWAAPLEDADVARPDWAPIYDYTALPFNPGAIVAIADVRTSKKFNATLGLPDQLAPLWPQTPWDLMANGQLLTDNFAGGYANSTLRSQIILGGATGSEADAFLEALVTAADGTNGVNVRNINFVANPGSAPAFFCRTMNDQETFAAGVEALLVALGANALGNNQGNNGLLGWVRARGVEGTARCAVRFIRTTGPVSTWSIGFDGPQSWLTFEAKTNPAQAIKTRLEALVTGLGNQYFVGLGYASFAGLGTQVYDAASDEYLIPPKQWLGHVIVRDAMEAWGWTNHVIDLSAIGSTWVTLPAFPQSGMPGSAPIIDVGYDPSGSMTAADFAFDVASQYCPNAFGLDQTVMPWAYWELYCYNGLQGLNHPFKDVLRVRVATQF